MNQTTSPVVVPTSGSTPTPARPFIINLIKKAIKDNSRILDILWSVGGGWEYTLQGVVCAQLLLDKPTNGLQYAICETEVYEPKTVLVQSKSKPSTTTTTERKAYCDLEAKSGAVTNICEFKNLAWPATLSVVKDTVSHSSQMDLFNFITGPLAFKADVEKISTSELRKADRKGDFALCAIGFFRLVDVLRYYDAPKNPPFDERPTNTEKAAAILGDLTKKGNMLNWWRDKLIDDINKKDSGPTGAALAAEVDKYKYQLSVEAVTDSILMVWTSRSGQFEASDAATGSNAPSTQTSQAGPSSLGGSSSLGDKNKNPPPNTNPATSDTPQQQSKVQKTGN